MLEGIRIVELEGLGPGPFAGMLLADLGAEVIVIHRDVAPASTSGDRSLLDRGKKSVVLNLKDDGDRDRLKALAASADGLIEGFRPGVMERLGIGPKDLMAENPRLVFGRVTGWGQDGPRATLAGHDFNYAALSGALWYGSEPGDAPFAPPTLIGDIGGGALYLVVGMLAALLRAQRSGRGEVVDAAMVDGSAHMLNLLMAARSAGLMQPGRGRSVLDGAPWSRCYQCADGEWLSVQCLEPQFYAEFLDRLEVADDAGFAQDFNPDHWPALKKKLSALIATKTIDEWSSVFEGSDACVAPVLKPEDAAEDPHMAARQTWFEIDGQLQARAAPRFAGEEPRHPAPPPVRGEHTEEILGALRS